MKLIKTTKNTHTRLLERFCFLIKNLKKGERRKPVHAPSWNGIESSLLRNFIFKCLPSHQSTFCTGIFEQLILAVLMTISALSFWLPMGMIENVGVLKIEV